MIFKLIDACYSDYGNVVINKIEDLKKLQFGNDHNLKNDELIIDFREMTIMIYNSWIEQKRR